MHQVETLVSAGPFQRPRRAEGVIQTWECLTEQLEEQEALTERRLLQVETTRLQQLQEEQVAVEAAVDFPQEIRR